MGLTQLQHVCVALQLKLMPRSFSLPDLLFSQGFGTRRMCDALAANDEAHLLSDSGSAIELADWDDDISEHLSDGLRYVVKGAQWQYYERAYVMLHKPVGYECSHKPKAWPPVYDLLPSPLRLRPTVTKIEGVQAVGRLDQDTTGLLLLSDDGAFIHRMSSPKHHVPKIYDVTCKHAVSDEQIAQLLAGVVLDDDPKPVKAAACVRLDHQRIALTLTEGKYHQVKRMVAAVSNRVEALHRSQIGGLTLGDLKLGEWRWLSASDLAILK
jgi:16S rRNA pseudouridine516 synthase